MEKFGVFKNKISNALEIYGCKSRILFDFQKIIACLRQKSILVGMWHLFCALAVKIGNFGILKTDNAHQKSFF